MKRRNEVRVLRLDVSEDPPQLVFVSRREAGLYFRAYVKPPGADVLLHDRHGHAPWCGCAMCRDGVTEFARLERDGGLLAC